MRRLPIRRRQATGQAIVPLFVPPGHFYSPIVDTQAVEADKARVWPQEPVAAGIDWNDAGHRHLLTNVFPRHLPLYDYPEELPDGPDLAAYYTQNSQFSWLDSRTLFALLHEWRPRRIIEVGSGYSSLLIADVNRRWFDSAIDVTCIEPFPPAFLSHRIEGLSRLIDDKVQNVAVSEFSSLAAGDVLFIDSSHVAKTGSDVNHLYFDVLPALAPGVHVHLHDIFLPNDYLQSWAIDENRSWNEQYLVHALLMYSHGYRVEFGGAYAFHTFPDLVAKALALPNGRSFGGCSLWLTKLL